MVSLTRRIFAVLNLFSGAPVRVAVIQLATLWIKPKNLFNGIGGDHNTLVWNEHSFMSVALGMTSACYLVSDL